MPPPRKARDAHAESVTPSEWAFMFSAPDAPGVDRGEWWSFHRTTIRCSDQIGQREPSCGAPTAPRL